MKTSPTTATYAALLALIASTTGLAQGSNDQGQQLFDGSCARCHGFDAAGAIGPNLQRSVLLRAENEPAFKALVQNGSPTRGMPATPGLSDRELSSIAAYVRSLHVVDPGVQAAQAARGEKIYEQQNCASCHIVYGEGRGIGPELTDIGVKRKAGQLRQDLIDPAASLPQIGGVTEFLPTRVVMNDGREVSGLRINEDAFSIQLRDMDDRLRTFKKTELKRIDKQFDGSLMPRVELDATKLDDLVAYLTSLRGTR